MVWSAQSFREYLAVFRASAVFAATRAQNEWMNLRRAEKGL
jgi:hypothetical protein